jgi:hypothetical protein
LGHSAFEKGLIVALRRKAMTLTVMLLTIAATIVPSLSFQRVSFRSKIQG